MHLFGVSPSLINIIKKKKKKKSTLWEELLTLTHQSTCRDTIYSKGKVSSVSQRVEGVGEGRIVF